MGAQIREYRQRIRSVKATQKITKAMELMAASRVVKARQRVEQTTPYANAITGALVACASNSDAEHPLTDPVENPKRAAVVILASNQGLAGGYTSAVLKEGEALVEKLTGEGLEVVPFLVGRKAIGFYRFRRRSYERGWEDSTDNPVYETAQSISEAVLERFLDDGEDAVDEVHIVYTQFRTMVTQVPRALRLLPMEVVDEGSPAASGAMTATKELLPLYEFEPDTEAVLDAILPQYVTHRIFNCLLQSAASELASRQRAMKSATDNADELIKTYTRLANQARQAQITNEISEIVGGADALAEA